MTALFISLLTTTALARSADATLTSATDSAATVAEASASLDVGDALIDGTLDGVLTIEGLVDLDALSGSFIVLLDPTLLPTSDADVMLTDLGQEMEPTPYEDLSQEMEPTPYEDLSQEMEPTPYESVVVSFDGLDAFVVLEQEMEPTPVDPHGDLPDELAGRVDLPVGTVVLYWEDLQF